MVPHFTNLRTEVIACMNSYQPTTMSRILRALAISAVATTTALVVSAYLRDREGKSRSGLLDEVKSTFRPSAAADKEPAFDLSRDEEEMLLNELKDHV